jgi:hypothetical protein
VGRLAPHGSARRACGVSRTRLMRRSSFRPLEPVLTLLELVTFTVPELEEDARGVEPVERDVRQAVLERRGRRLGQLRLGPVQGGQAVQELGAVRRRRLSRADDRDRVWRRGERHHAAALERQLAHVVSVPRLRMEGQLVPQKVEPRARRAVGDRRRIDGGDPGPPRLVRRGEGRAAAVDPLEEPARAARP